MTVSGTNLLSPISISSGGEYAVNGGAYTSTAGIVVNGDSITVRQTSSPNFSTTTDVVLTIGGVSGTFNVTTRAQVADLSITKTSNPNPPVVGQPLTFTLTVTNAGPDAADGVTVTDLLAFGLTFSAASAGCSYEAVNPWTVTCDLGSMASGAEKTVDIVVIPTVARPLSNTATVTGIGDAGGENNSSTRDVAVEVHLYLPLLIKNM